MKHSEQHRTHRVGWLRAAVLGANDGIVSTASCAIDRTRLGVSCSSLLFLALLGAYAARVGGAPVGGSSVRREALGKALEW